MEQELRSSKAARDSILYVELLLILLLITCSIIVPYLAYQQAFLGGDINEGFYNRAIDVADTFRSSPLTAIQTVFQDASSTYNSFYTLPLIPFFLLFGNSYLIYVLALAIVYLLPLNLVLGLISTRLIPVYPTAVFISTVFISTLVAPNWVTVLVGHPDIGATLLIALAILFSLRGVHRSFGWLLVERWQIPVIGFLLGAAVLFRRHYAYAALAVVGAMLFYTAIGVWQEFRRTARLNWLRLIGFGIRLGLLLATSLATLAIFAPEFTRQALSTDYVSLYDSWSRTVSESIVFYGMLYGLGTWLMVVLGYSFGLWTRILAPASTTFVILFGSISIAIWFFKLRYTETYYAIHFVPLIVLGITALFWTIWFKVKRRWRGFLLALISLYLSFNFIACLTPIGSFQNRLRPVFAANYPPFVRKNYNDIVRLAQFLRQLAPNGEPIFVIHSGPLPNHVLRAAERSIYGREGAILTLREGSVIDSIGYYSLSELLEAEYVVFTEPFMAWHEGQQDTAKVVFDAFQQAWEITEDFEKLPEQFDLQDGIMTSIYRRIRPTSIDRAVRTLHAMQTAVNKPLGGQLDWVTISPPFNSVIREEAANNYFMRVRSISENSENKVSDNANQAGSKTFLYLGSLSDRSSLQGQVNLRHDDCAGVSFTATSLDIEGNVLHQSDRVLIVEDAPLQVKVDSTGASYLVMEVQNLEVEAGQADRCALTIENLVIQ